MLAAFEAACCAANGVPLRDPRKPSEPELFHASTLPVMSVHQSVRDVLALFLLERLLLAFFLGRRGAACCYGFCHKFSFQWPVASCQFVSACAKVGVTATDHWQLATTP